MLRKKEMNFNFYYVLSAGFFLVGFIETGVNNEYNAKLTIGLSCFFLICGLLKDICNAIEKK